MVIEKVKFSNYRCFSSLELSFKKNINLLIGDNSSGKSTIIQGLSSVLNSFFSGFSDENTRFFGLSKDDFTINSTETGLANEKPIAVEFDFMKTEARLELHSKKGRTLQKPLYPILEKGNQLLNNLFDVANAKQIQALPLIASFSTSDIHKNRKTNVKAFLKYYHKPSFGYYECLQGDGFLSYWTRRLLVLKEANKGELEIEGVITAFKDALGVDGCNILTDVEIRHNQGSVYYIFRDGREIETKGLSDGYRRLINIIIDIAFRSMILNMGIYGKEACKKTMGTVLIDELDLHLHPSLQTLVLKGLRNAFPELQFVVTTHAPMIMTNIALEDENIIYKLKYLENEKYYAAQVVELYGLDANSIIESVLDTVPRSKDVDLKLEKLFDLIDREDYGSASGLLIEMQEEFGDGLPDLIKAEAMLNFLPGKDD